MRSSYRSAYHQLRNPPFSWLNIRSSIMRQVNSEWHPCLFEFPIYRGQRAYFPSALLWSGFASPVLPCHCALFPAEASDSHEGACDRYAQHHENRQQPALR